jgi:hypothetical protein
LTVVLICLIVAIAFAVLGALLLQSGRREERDGGAPVRRRRPTGPRPRPPEAAPVPRRISPEPAVPAPATVGAVDIQAAGRARLEAALARARARLNEEGATPNP